MKARSKFLKISSLSVAIALACGCSKQPQSPTDPYESFNRKVCVVNTIADKMFFLPLAALYVTVTPNFLQEGIHNMFKNLFTPTTVFNDILQGRGDFTAADTTRIVINSTLGIFGFFDVAKHLKLPYHYEDFGMTMAYWGATTSNYLVTPILGPRTMRDAFGIPFDIATNPITYITPFRRALVVAVAAMIDTRAQYLPADAMINQSFDPYSFVRDAYLQNRAQMISTNNSMKSYRDFQEQQLQSFAPPAPANFDIGIQSPKAPATQAPIKQPTRLYQPPTAAPKLAEANTSQ